MEPRIEILESKKLIGMRLKMSQMENKTAQLWQTFMPRRAEVESRSTSEYISMQIFDDTQSELFDPNTMFEKWAAIEVSNHETIPTGMEPYTMKGGMYAVFIHKGLPSDFPKTMGHIFGSWLPGSKYELDNREHFELLPESYRPDDPNAEEEVWIPIKERK